MKLKLFTLILVTFVFMQVFNYINCRKIGQKEYNVFENLFSPYEKINGYFWFIIVFVSVGQVLMVQIFYMFTRTTPLSKGEWGACIMVGSSVIIIALLFKKLGSKLLRLIPFAKFVDEDQA